MTVHATPFELVEGVGFGSTITEASAILGPPDEEEVDDIMNEVQRRHGQARYIFAPADPDDRMPVDVVDVDALVLTQVHVESDDVQVGDYLLSDDDQLDALLTTHEHTEDRKYIAVPDLGLLLRKFRLKGRDGREVTLGARSEIGMLLEMLEVQ